MWKYKTNRRPVFTDKLRDDGSEIKTIGAQAMKPDKAVGRFVSGDYFVRFEDSVQNLAPCSVALFYSESGKEDAWIPVVIKGERLYCAMVCLLAVLFFRLAMSFDRNDQGYAAEYRYRSKNDAKRYGFLQQCDTADSCYQRNGQLNSGCCCQFQIS